MAHYLDTTGLSSLWDKIKKLIPTSLKNPNSLTLQTNGTTVATYDGSAAKTVNITPSAIGASATSHNHNDTYVKKVGDMPTTNDIIITPTNLSASQVTDNGGGIHVKGYTGTAFQLWLHDTSNVWYKKTGDGAWGKMDAGNADYATTAGTANAVAWGNVTSKPSTFTPATHTHTFASLATKPTTLSGYGITDAINTSAKGAANGVVPLNSSKQIDSQYLPSYVDDVLEYTAKASFPTTGETGKIYVDTTTNLTYRWSGSAYVEISPSLALGTTSSTAFAGDKGNVAYTHSQTTGNPHGTTKANIGLGNVDNTADSAKNVATATRTTNNGNNTEVASGTTANAPTTGMKYTSGMYMTQTYGNSTTPTTCGNIINVAGAGTGQLLLGWSGTDSTTERVYYRSHRDTSTGGWGAWKKLAYTDDIPSSLKNPNALTMQANGTTVATYDGSSAKTVNITPSVIGAAASSHTHTKSQITDFPSTLKNPNALSWSGYSSGTYDGSAAKTITIPNNTNQLTNGAGYITSSGSISGNAATATSATLIKKNSSFNDGGIGRMSYYDADISNTTNNAAWSAPSSGWHQIIHNDLSVSNYWTELAFPVNDTNGLAWRQRRSNAYYGWYRILDSNNYNNYAPSKTGTGASGTWGINISGTAASASSVAWANVSGKPTNVSSFTNDSGYTTNKGTVTSVAVKMNGAVKGTVTSSGTIDLGTVLTAHQSLTDYVKKGDALGDISIGRDDTTVSLTETFNDGNTRILTFNGASTGSAGVMTAADKKTLDAVASTYLPLSGGTVTGDLELDGHADMYSGVSIEGTSTTQYSLDVTGDSSFTGEVGVDGALNVTGTSYFGDEAKFNSDIYAQANLKVDMCTAIGTDVDTSYALKVSGKTYLGGDVTATRITATTVNAPTGSITAKNIIINGGQLGFISSGKTYHLNMTKAIELGLVTV